MMAGLLCVALAGSPNAGVFSTHRVFGPEVKTGPYKHPAAIAQLTDGAYYMVYYGGAGEYAVDTGVFGSRRSAHTGRWSAPVRIAHDPFRSVGNAVVWQEPNGPLWLFYVVRWGGTWSTSRIQAKVSRDGARTWSDSFVVSEEPGTMVRGKPIMLSDGDILLPAYRETGTDTERVPPDSTSCFLRYSHKTHAWTKAGSIRSAKGNIQPAVAEIAPGKLVAYCRRGGGYTPVSDGYIVVSRSANGGRTWTRGKDSHFPNPNAAVDLVQLRNGHLLLIYNDNMNDGTPLTAALSKDRGKTWPWKRNIGTGNHDYGYPFAVQGSDGLVHMVFTTEERKVVNYCFFDESWVMAR